MHYIDAVEALVKVGYKWTEAMRTALYGMVIQQHGWEGLGFSRQQIYVMRKAYQQAGLDPLEIDYSGLPAFMKRSILSDFEKAILKKTAEEKNRLEEQAVQLAEKIENLEALGLVPGQVEAQQDQDRDRRKASDATLRRANRRSAA